MKTNIKFLSLLLITGLIIRLLLFPTGNIVNCIQFLAITSAFYLLILKFTQKPPLALVSAAIYATSPLSTQSFVFVPLQTIILVFFPLIFFATSYVVPKIKISAAIILLTILFFFQFPPSTLSLIHPHFLFFQSNWDSFNFLAPYTGYLLLPSILFLPLGLYYFFKKPTPLGITFLALLFLAPIFKTMEIVIILPLSYFTALGIYQTANLFNPKYRQCYYTAVFLLLLLFFLYSSDLYLFHAPKLTPYFLQNSL